MIIAIAGVSCASSRKAYQGALYFQDIGDSLKNLPPVSFEQRFQPGDILHVTVVTPNEKMGALFNQPVSMPSDGTAGGPSGYLVDEDSTIFFPLLGRLKVSGHTKRSFTADLTERLRYYLDSPIVAVRLLNYRITMLGEFNKPGTLVIPNERVTILDAIGLAGDMNMFAKRDSVMIIRTNEGHVELGSLNMNAGNIFDSPYFYLKQNDVVYVKMQKRKLAVTDQVTLRNVSLGLGILSALAAITATVINITK
ncbi:MAG: polysaccharide biosynthesis/export family protein [Candidatus Pseudobacter hemicellulosilyticus]|uniref:Polysaccharide biosynthesis/export family protein n=1 Tax=Candidatus Pseudobacter hemicellulosilyticus TaxID=3121375 RepID=A0AAJ6BGB6_9BACT|nr:MAG: polysaccharide biosynthesis/export family protein [Pseudobacter sp.]